MEDFKGVPTPVAVAMIGAIAAVLIAMTWFAVEAHRVTTEIGKTCTQSGGDWDGGMGTCKHPPLSGPRPPAASSSP